MFFFSILYGIRKYEINRREQKAQIRESGLRIKAIEAEKRALEIENQRKIRELEQARQLQLSMLSRDLPDLPGLEISAKMRTATEVGWDYYDFLVQDNGVINIAFGDATGHGLQAGTMVTLMKGLFTSNAEKLEPQEFMIQCSRAIKDINLGRILMSFSYIKIHQEKMFLSSAGMPPIPYHRKGSDHVEEILVQGMPLGGLKNATYQLVERNLTRGETILLLSDGLPEQMNSAGIQFDYEQVKKYFIEAIDRTPDAINDNLITAGDRWMNGIPQDDDMTFVIIRVK